MPGISSGMLSRPSQMPVWLPVRASAMRVPPAPPPPPPFCQKGALIPTSQVNPWEGLESKEWSQLRTSNHDFGRTPTPPPDTFLRLAFHLLLPVLLQFALPLHGLFCPTLLCQRVVRARGGALPLLSCCLRPHSPSRSARGGGFNGGLTKDRRPRAIPFIFLTIVKQEVPATR